mgnify:CR=1 FL=1
MKKILYISLLLICANSLSMHVVLAGGGWLGPYFVHAEGLGIRDTSMAQELYHLKVARSSDTRSFYSLIDKHLKGLKNAALLTKKTPSKLTLVLCPTTGPGVYRTVELVFGVRDTGIQNYRQFKCGDNLVANWVFEQQLQHLENERKSTLK